jgi:sterol 3beta-glucosyltransferase
MVLESENSIKLMKHFFKVLNSMKIPLRKSYFEAISNVDYIIANSATLPIVSAVAEKQNKKVALTYFMPPVVPTSEFPLGDFDFLNFPFYNKLTYKIAQSLYWKFVKEETNEYRQALGLPVLRENLISYIDRQKPLDLYCLSQTLIPQPKDWENHHKITGFLTIPDKYRKNHFLDVVPTELSEWLITGNKPIYIGFGSNGLSNQERIQSIITEILDNTNERVLFCTGWSLFENLPNHKNLFITKYVNHEIILPQCKIGIFHGGAGTLATMLRNNLPVIVVSLYTDQPTWGKIVERKKLGFHIPAKKLTAKKLIKAIQEVQSEEYKLRIGEVGQAIRNENGLENAVREIEMYFK